MKKGVLLYTILCLILLTIAGCGSTQNTQNSTQSGTQANESSKLDYPTKPVEFVIWASPGGGSDIFVRNLAKAAEPYMPQPFVPINKPGGGGATGMAYTATKPADGYTLLAVTTNLVLTPALGNVEYTYEDFDPIARIGLDATVIVSKADGPIQSIDDLIMYAKDKGNINWGTFGVGTSDHVASAKFAKMAGINASYVPFEGGGDAIAALMGGHVDVISDNPSEVADQVTAGILKIIGVFSENRWDAFPDVPTLKETGFDINVETWRGVVAPKGTPPEIISYLDEVLQKAMEDEAFLKYLSDNMVKPAYMSSDEFRKFIEEQDIFYRQELKDLGLVK